MSVRFNLDPATLQLLEEAAKHYDFRSVGNYLRICSLTLIRHHQRGDVLVAPFSFITVPNGKEANSQ